jgi:hypothetical protein
LKKNEYKFKNPPGLPPWLCVAVALRDEMITLENCPLARELIQQRREEIREENYWIDSKENYSILAG